MLPWRETSIESERLRFIEFVKAGETTIAEACRQWAISRKTGYKLLKRYELYGAGGLRNLSRAAHHHPNETASAVDRIIAAKRIHPTWGPKKIVAWLSARETDMQWPSHSTAGAILDHAGLVTHRRRRRRATPWGEPFAHATCPNDVWAIDLKGHFRTTNGIRIDPLTVQDAMSRYLLACDGLARPTGLEIKPVLERIFRECGLPRVIHTDNGPPFASVGLGSLSPLSVWWIKLGIIPERIDPGHPEQNGRLERLHRTLKAETASPPRASRSAQRRTFDRFRHEYNTERPHEALGQRPPAQLYVPSERPYPARISSPEYEAEVTVRRVRRNGEIKWKGQRLYVSESLAGEPIGLVQRAEHTWALHFGPLHIGDLDDRAMRIDRSPTKVLPMSLG